MREDPVDAFWNARGQVGRVLLATEIYHQGDTPGAVRLLDQDEAGLNDLLAEDRNRDTVALHLAYVASSRAYFAIDDPTRALEFLEEGFDTLEARLGDEEGGAVLFDYYVRAVILEAAVRHQAGLPAPEDRIERALELMRERGEPDQSVADAAALALLELAGGLDDRGAAQFARFDGKGYRAVFYRSMRERLTS